ALAGQGHPLGGTSIGQTFLATERLKIYHSGVGGASAICSGCMRRTNRFAGWGGYFQADQAAREALSATRTPSTAAGGADGERGAEWRRGIAADTGTTSTRRS